MAVRSRTARVVRLSGAV